jgi:N12 class adenine-specific DNA methylase/predicted kinase
MGSGVRPQVDPWAELDAEVEGEAAHDPWLDVDIEAGVQQDPFAGFGPTKKVAAPRGKKVIPEGELSKGWRSGIARGNIAGLGEVLEAVGMEGWGAALKRFGEKEAFGSDPRVPSLRNIRTVEDFQSWAAWSLGQTAGSMVPTIAGAVAGTAIAGPVGTVLGAALPSYVLNTGELRVRLREAGVPDDELDRWALGGGIPIAALDMVVPGRVAERVAGKAAAKGAGGAMKRIGGAAAKDMATEGGTEGTQTLMQQAIEADAIDLPPNERIDGWEILDATAAGGLMGVVAGGGSQTMSELRQRKARPGTPPPPAAAPANPFADVDAEVQAETSAAEAPTESAGSLAENLQEAVAARAEEEAAQEFQAEFDGLLPEAPADDPLPELWLDPQGPYYRDAFDGVEDGGEPGPVQFRQLLGFSVQEVQGAIETAAEVEAMLAEGINRDTGRKLTPKQREAIERDLATMRRDTEAVLDTIEDAFGTDVRGWVERRLAEQNAALLEPDVEEVERVHRAAFQFDDGSVAEGVAHGLIEIPQGRAVAESGFTTSKGRFVTTEEAEAVARAAGQIEEGDVPEDSELASHDIRELDIAQKQQYAERAKRPKRKEPTQPDSAPSLDYRKQGAVIEGTENRPDLFDEDADLSTFTPAELDRWAEHVAEGWKFGSVEEEGRAKSFEHRDKMRERLHKSGLYDRYLKMQPDELIELAASVGPRNYKLATASNREKALAKMKGRDPSVFFDATDHHALIRNAPKWFYRAFHLGSELESIRRYEKDRKKNPKSGFAVDGSDILADMKERFAAGREEVIKLRNEALGIANIEDKPEAKSLRDDGIALGQRFAGSRESDDAALEATFLERLGRPLRKGETVNRVKDPATGRPAFVLHNDGADWSTLRTADELRQPKRENPVRIEFGYGKAPALRSLLTSNTRPGEKPFRLTELTVNADGSKTPTGHKDFDTLEEARRYVMVYRTVSQPYEVGEAAAEDKYNTPDIVEMRRRSEAIPSTHSIDTAEREQLREKIAEKLRGRVGKNLQQKKARIVVGLPGSGKSSAVVDQVNKGLKAVVISADLPKSQLPEFGEDGIGAMAVHRESSGIVWDRVFPHALEHGFNIILDTVGGDARSLSLRAEALRYNGYEVELDFVDVPAEVAADRLWNRYNEKAQGFVDPATPLKIGNAPEKAYEYLKEHQAVDVARRWDNNVERGEKPKLVDTWAGNRGRVPGSRAGVARVEPGDTPAERPASAEPAVTQGADNGEPGTTATGRDGQTVRGEPSGSQPGTLDEAEGERGAEHAPRGDERGDRAVIPDDAGAAPGEPAEGRPAGRTGPRLNRGFADEPGAGERGARAGDGRVSGEATGGTGRAVPEPGEHSGSVAAPVRDYRITDEDKLGEGGPRAKAKANVEAIRLMKQIVAENRPATPDEQKVLVKYTGWGALTQAVFADKPEYADVQQELKELLTPAEFADARASGLNAHYTSVPIIRAVYDALKHIGLRGGRVIEPSAGIGNFLGLAPRSFRWSATELDQVTGNILKLLYPDADVRVDGFETLKTPDGSFDAAIGNVPFGSYKVHDPRYNKLNLTIHNYFFVKALDLVRPGGVVAFITSRYTLDAQAPAARRAMSEAGGELIGAIRLPSGAFAKNAGTQVVTDLIFLRKREQGEAASKGWIDVARTETENGETVQINSYYVEHPEMVLGKAYLGRGMYGQNEYLLKAPADLPKRLAAAVEKLPLNVINLTEAPVRDVTVAENTDRVVEGSFVLKDGKILQVVDGKLTDANIPKARRPRIAALTEIKVLYRQILDGEAQGAPSAELEKKRKQLNKLYDAFRRKYGPISQEKRTESTISKGKNAGKVIVRISQPQLDGFMDDPEWSLVASLDRVDPETGIVEKAAGLIGPQLLGQQLAEKVESPDQGLLVVLAESGTIDLARVAQLVGQTEAEVKDALIGRMIFENPITREIEPAETYLAGNVKRKLAEAQEAAATDLRFRPNVAALEKVQPKDLKPDQISVHLGSSWVPTELYAAFIDSLLGGKGATVKYVPAVSRFKVEGTWDQERSAENTTKYGHPRKNALKLIELGLNGQKPKITWRDSDGKTHIDAEATEEANAKLDSIMEKFGEWAMKDPRTAERLTAVYNDTMNTDVMPKPDGSHITLPGAATHINGRAFQLMRHQKNAIWRALRFGNTLLAHPVGAGKTFEMVAIIMESKRLGFARRPVLTVPNHMLGQAAREFRLMYPNAKLLVATERDFEKSRRRAFIAKAAAHEWDAIIMTHSSFGQVPMSREAQEEYIREQLDALEEAIAESRQEEGKKSATVKELENAKKKLEAKLAKLVSDERQDDFITFEQMNVDMIVVDEFHMFKNLPLITRKQGMANDGSTRAVDMFLKSVYVNRINPGRGFFGATGTPLTNSISEAYTMMRYFQPKLLEEMGMTQFDSWIATFGVDTQELEMNVAGKYVPKTRFRRFDNVADLAMKFRQAWDVVTEEEINLPKPVLIGGKPEVVEAPETSFIKRYIQYLQARAEEVSPQTKHIDNLLKIASDGKHAALDLRLVSRTIGDLPNSKVNQAVRRIHEIWKDTAEIKGTQAVFLDLSTPGSDSSARGGEPGLNLYDDIRDKLVALGVPRGEIRFIQEVAGDNKKKQALLDLVNEGRVRVIIGSTEGMGAGTNMQKRLVALHRLDVPWRPDWVTQSEGRILRMGNMLYDTGKIPGVRIIRYVSVGSFDVFMWQTVERKIGFISQAMNADPELRTMEDISDEQLSAAQIKALATGDPDLIKSEGLKVEVQKLVRKRNAHKDEQWQAARELRAMPDRLKSLRERIDGLAADLKRRVDTGGEKFVIKVGDREIKKRPDAGEALAKEVKKAVELQRKEAHQYHDAYRIGEFAGFELWIEPLPPGRPGLSPTASLKLIGDLTYVREVTGDNSGPSLVATLEAVPRTFENTQSMYEDDLQSAERRQKTLEELRGDWPLEGQLASLEKELAEVEARLKVSRGDKKEQTHPADWWKNNWDKADERIEVWKPAESGQEKLAGAAIRVKATGNVYTGTIHVEAMGAAEDAGENLDAPHSFEDGFITSTGRFVDRAEASRIAGKDEDPEFDALGNMDVFSVADPITLVLKSLSALRKAKAATAKAARPLTPSALPDVEERWQAAKGITPPSVWQRVQHAIEQIKKGARHYQEIDESSSPKMAEVQNILLEVEHANDWAKVVAHDNIGNIVQGLTPAELDTFTRYLALNDILKDIEAGLYPSGAELPFGYPDESAIEADLRKVEAAATSNPKIQAALNERARFAQELTQKLVSLDLLDEKVLDDDRYYHRQVMEYHTAMDRLNNAPGLGSRDVRVHRKGFQRARSGGGDFNTSYQEAEFEWVAQAVRLIHMSESLQSIQKLADITPQLKAEARALNRAAYKAKTGKPLAGVTIREMRMVLGDTYVEWEDLIPADHKEWQPVRGNYFFNGLSLSERALHDAITGLVPIDAAVKDALMVGTRKPTWVIPEGLATTLDHFGSKRDEGNVERAWTRMLSWWKQWQLLSPSRAVKYNLNNMSGDFDAALLYPKMLKYSEGAINDLEKWMYAKADPKLQREMQDLTKLRVVGNTLTMQEIPDVNEMPAFRRLVDTDPLGFMKLVSAYWRHVRLLTQLRENILRLAAFRYFEAEINAGRGDRLYGASNPVAVRALTDPRQKAALLARDIIGDYGAISTTGQFFRSHLFPFFSWTEINAKRYVRLFRNVVLEGGEVGRIGKRAAAVGAAAGGRTALSLGYRLGQTTLLANAFFFLTALWNQLMFPEEEEELRREARSNHLIIGREADGSIRTIRIEGAFADFLEWFSLHDYPSDIADLRRGAAGFGDKARDALQAPANRIVQMWEPASKTLFEAMTRRSLYPNVFKPRSLRDRGDYVASSVSMGWLYRKVTDKPVRPSNPVLSLFAYRTDPGEAAYYHVRELAGKYMEEQGRGGSAIVPNERANALYYWKKAAEWGHDRQAERWLKRYYELGGTPKGAKQSVSRGAPLAFMPIALRGPFVRSLDSDGRKALTIAERWHREGQGDRALETMRRVRPRSER